VQKLDEATQLLSESGLAKGFEVESGQDYGAGPIDVVWKIPVHPSLPEIKCGFVLMGASEGGDQDTQDNQFSIRKVEEAAMRGLRSGMDKIYLVTENEEMAKSVTGQIEWLASHGSLLRLDSIALGISPPYHGPSTVTPSQKRVPKGEKIRKKAIRNREAKLNKYNRPKRKSSFQRQALRESRIDRNSRPKDQVPKRRR
jgi:hypothetical protein